jgi:hypothetical protein
MHRGLNKETRTPQQPRDREQREMDETNQTIIREDRQTDDKEIGKKTGRYDKESTADEIERKVGCLLLLYMDGLGKMIKERGRTRTVLDAEVTTNESQTEPSLQNPYRKKRKA